MCNVKVMVEQLQCASVYKEPVLISENHFLLFFVLFQSLSNICFALTNVSYIL